MQTKHLIFFSSLFALCALLGAGIVMIGKHIPDSRIPGLGTALPRLAVSDTFGRRVPFDRTGKFTVIVVYRPGCAYCARQLEQMLPVRWSSADRTLILVGHDVSTPDIALASTVSRLRGAGALAATLQGNGVLGKFGTLLTPVTFVYDRAGRLSSVFVGEVGPGVIANATRSRAKVQDPAAQLHAPVAVEHAVSPGVSNALAR